MEAQLAKLIKLMAELELQCDIARYALREAPGFSAESLFNKLDKYQKGHLSVDEIKIFMIENNLFATEGEILGIINCYDKHQTGRLGYNEFVDLVTPKAFPFVEKQKDHTNLHDLEFLLKIVFERELNFSRAINPLRATIQEKKDYTPLDLFRMIDVDDRTSFGYKDLDEFMQKQEYYLSNAEVLAFFRRVDKYSTAQISLKEFKSYVLPEFSSLLLKDFSTYPHRSQEYLQDKKASSTGFFESQAQLGFHKSLKDTLYKTTPYSLSDPFEHVVEADSHLRSSLPHVWTSSFGEIPSSQALPKPQIPKHTFMASGRPLELLKYRDFYPHSSGKYFDDYYYPFVRRYQYYPLKYESSFKPHVIKPTDLYYTNRSSPYSTYHYFPTSFQHPTLNAKRETERGFLPDPIEHKGLGSETAKLHSKYLTSRDIYHHPKMVDLKYRRSADDTFYSTNRDRKSMSAQKEVMFTRKLYDWQQYTKAYDDNVSNYRLDNITENAKTQKSDHRVFDLASTAASGRANMIATSTSWRDPSIGSTTYKSGGFAANSLYNIDDIKAKYRNVKDFPQGTYDFARKY